MEAEAYIKFLAGIFGLLSFRHQPMVVYVNRALNRRYRDQLKNVWYKIGQSWVCLYTIYKPLKFYCDIDDNTISKIWGHARTDLRGPKKAC